ncbi:MAG TPA: class I SAM-dependent methyltransferase [Prosthecobacter sp.]
MITEKTNCLLCGADDAEIVASGPDYDCETTTEVFHIRRCRQCAHTYLNPRPTVECASEIYPSDYYTLDASHQPDGFSIMGRMKDLVVRGRLRAFLRGVPQGGTVVDLGCGDGALLLAMRRERPDTRLMGVDFAVSAPQRKKMEDAGISVIESPLETAPLPDNVSLVIMNQVIEHLWDVDACMEKVRACLRPGGMFSVCTPNTAGYDRPWFHDGAWGGYYFPRHLNLFSQDGLSRYMERFGMRVKERNSLLAPLIWMSTARALQIRRRWPRWMRLKDGNVAFLVMFTLIDMVAMLLGKTSSNQQVVAVKK